MITMFLAFLLTRSFGVGSEETTPLVIRFCGR